MGPRPGAVLLSQIGEIENKSMAKKNHKSTIQNGIFSGVEPQNVEQFRDAATRDPRIRLCSTYMTPSREVVPVAEALVAFDPETGDIVKFIGAFVPGSPDSRHDGVKFIISKHDDGKHKPIIINNGDPSTKPKGFYWNPNFQTAHLDYGKLPYTVPHAEWRVLRAYRHDMRVPYRFEVLAFDIPPAGVDVDKRTMRPVLSCTGLPPIKLAGSYKGFQWWQNAILMEMSMFSGVDLSSLGIEESVKKKVKAGEVSAETAKDMLKDHSEPEEVIEPLAQTFGVVGMQQPEEGKAFYAPPVPVGALAEPQTMPLEHGSQPEDPMGAAIMGAVGMGMQGFIDRFSDSEEAEEEEIPRNPELAPVTDEDNGDSISEFPEE